MGTNKKKLLIWGLVAFLIILVSLIYKFIDPLGANFFPTCPFYETTSYKCPLCGSQRVIHHLLNFEFLSAAKENFLLLLFVPYAFFGFWLAFVAQKSDKNQKIWKRFYGKKAVFIVLLVVIAFWLFRNIANF